MPAKKKEDKAAVVETKAAAEEKGIDALLASVAKKIDAAIEESQSDVARATSLVHIRSELGRLGL